MMPYNLKQISLKNFRVFSETVSFEIKPLTILTGTNSSGKSSLLKAILLLKESSDLSKFNNIKFGSRNIQLGTFDSCKTQNTSENKLEFSLDFLRNSYLIPTNIEFLSAHINVRLVYTQNHEDGKLNLLNIWGADYITKRMVPLFVISLSENLEDYSATAYLHIKHFVNTISSTIKKFDSIYPKQDSIPIGTNKLGDMTFEKELAWHFDYNEPLLNNLPFPKEYLKLDDCILDISAINKIIKFENEDDKSRILFILNEYILDHLSEFTISEEYWNRYCSSTGMDFSEQKVSDILWFYTQVFPEFEGITNGTIENINFNKSIADYTKPFTKLSYIEFRNLEKYLPQIEKIKNTLIKDLLRPDFYKFYTEFLLPYISKMYDQLLKPLPFHYLDVFKSDKKRIFLDKDDLTDFEVVLSKLAHEPFSEDQKKFIRKWIVKFEIGNDVIFERISGSATKVIIDRNNGKIELADLGFGTSQILSIIINIVFHARQVKRSLETIVFLLEEPETNLHPKLQSLLGEFFVEVINSFNVNFVIETHSEYLIRKLQYLTANKSIGSHDSLIYYFNNQMSKKENEKIVRRIAIDDDGMLDSDFGEGFFDEADRMAIDLYRLQRNKHQSN